MGNKGEVFPPTPAQLQEVKNFISRLPGGNDEDILVTVKDISKAVSGWTCLPNDRTGSIEHMFVTGMRDLANEFKDKVSVTSVERLVKCAGLCAQEGLCNTGTTCTMMLPLLEVLPITMCDPYFALLDNYVAAYAQNRDYTPVLDIGNNIMARTSKAQSASLNGRVLMWMARVFPPFHSSGTRANLPSGECVTYTPETPKEDTTNMSLDEALGGAGQLDGLFCNTFWGLQGFFANPALVNTKLDQLIKCMDTVLDSFEAHKIVVKNGSINRNVAGPTTGFGGDTPNTGATTGTGRKREHEEVEEGQITKKARAEDDLTEDGMDEEKGSDSAIDGEGDVIPPDHDVMYYPGYLTSRRALALQLKDSSFRLAILMQIMVFSQAHTNFWRGRPNPSKTKAPPAGLIEYLTKIQPRIAASFDGIPRGKTILAEMKHLLAHELRWIEWKNENGWDIENGVPPLPKDTDRSDLKYRLTRAVPRPKADTGPEEEAAKKNPKSAKAIGQVSQSLPPIKPTVISKTGPRFAASMAKTIYQDATDMTCLKTKPIVPTFDSYFEEAFDQLDPESGVEKEYYLTERYDWVWVALRLLGRVKIDFYDRIGADKSLATVMQEYKEQEVAANETTQNGDDKGEVQDEKNLLEETKEKTTPVLSMPNITVQSPETVTEAQ